MKSSTDLLSIAPGTNCVKAERGRVGSVINAIVCKVITGACFKAKVGIGRRWAVRSSVDAGRERAVGCLVEL